MHDVPIKRIQELDEAETTSQPQQLSTDQLAALRESSVLLEKLRNRYRAKRCFIMGDISGLNESDRSLLKNEITFCLDKSFRSFEELKLTPSFYVCSDGRVFDYDPEAFARIFCQKFLTFRDFSFIPNRQGCCFLYTTARPSHLFIKDVTAGIPDGQAAFFMAMELAYFMGFIQVFLIGLEPPVRLGCTRQNETRKREISVPVIPDGAGPRRVQSIEVDADRFFRSAKCAFEADGRILIDVTPCGSLTVFPKSNLAKIAETDRQVALKCEVLGEAAALEAHRMEHEYLVSAIVSTYNAERFIRGCLEDLEHQTIADQLEIIVVISGSQQEEERIVDEFLLRFDNIRVIKTAVRETVYQAWNRGIRAARGKYLTNANTDDRHSPNAFEKMAGALEADPFKVLVYIDQKYFKETGGQARAFMFDRDRGSFSRNRLLEECFVGSQPMWRACIHEEYGYFDEAFFTAGDYEFWLRIAQNHQFLHLHELLGERLIRSDSLEYGGNSQLSCIEAAIIQKCYAYAAVHNIPVTQLGLSRHPVFSAWCELNLIKSHTIAKTTGKRNAPHAAARVVYDNRSAGAAPRLSVVITTFNRKDDLLSNLRALNLQACLDFETIVVNNGARIDELASGQLETNYPYCYLENPCNYGPSHARNLGVRNSRSDIVAILDDDAIADPGWVQAIAKHFEEDSISALRGRVRPKAPQGPVMIPVNYDLGDTVLYNTAGLEMNTAFRRKLFLELGGYDEFMFGFEGAELSYRIFTACRQRVDCIKYYPDVRIFHDFSDNPERLLETQLRLRAMTKIAHKKWPDLNRYISFMWGMIPANQQNDDYAWLTENALFCFQGSPKESAAFAAKAIAVNGTEPLGFIVHGNALLKMGDYKLALASFGEAAHLLDLIQKNPEMERAFRENCGQLRYFIYMKLSRCLEGVGDFDKAKMVREQAGKLKPLNLPPQSLSRRAPDLLSRSQERLSEYKQRHTGQRCIIIGNGPSLNKMDLSFLENEITFGMNRIYLMFDKWSFRPTYYVSVNPLVLEQSAPDILKIKAPKFISHKGIPFIPDSPEDVMFIRSIPKWVFSTDPRNGLCEGWTVTYFAMQLAYYMGFEEVVLIGVDHHFVTQGDPNKEVVSEGDDPNHFHPGYFGKGVRWHLPDLERSEKSYRMAQQAFEAAGRRILDATVGGRLTVFPKIDYRKFFDLPLDGMKGSGKLKDVPGVAMVHQARRIADAGNHLVALEMLKEAIRLTGGDSVTYQTIASVLNSCGREEDAQWFDYLAQEVADK